MAAKGWAVQLLYIRRSWRSGKKKNEEVGKLTDNLVTVR